MDDTTAQTTPAPTQAPPARRRWLRFSLRTLVIGVLLIGSGMGLWWRWEPWVIHCAVETGGCEFPSFSPDGNYVGFSRKTVTVVDCNKGRVIARHELAWDYVYPPFWSTDSRWLFLLRPKPGSRLADLGPEDGLLWDMRAWTTLPIATGDGKSFSPTEEGAKRGYRAEQFPKNEPWFSRNPCEARDGRAIMWRALGVYLYSSPDSPEGTWLAVLMPHGNKVRWRGAISDDGDWIVTDGEGAEQAYIWHRRRPEYWWGIAWLPEFWLTVVFSVGLVWSVWRDRRSL
ncbi:MAG TPA: hypothetical protein VGP72_18725 [Planctomycetota bacterium]|jgi:hypothetical protein